MGLRDKNLEQDGKKNQVDDWVKKKLAEKSCKEQQIVKSKIGICTKIAKTFKVENSEISSVLFLISDTCQTFT